MWLVHILHSVDGQAELYLVDVFYVRNKTFIPLKLHCAVVIILVKRCSKTKQPQNRDVFHSDFNTSIVSVSVHGAKLDLVTTQLPVFIIYYL